MSGEVVLRRFAIPLTLFAIVFSANISLASPKPQIVDVKGQVRGREAHVFFTLGYAFTPEMVEALTSGIEISFKTVVRVERVHRNWFDAPVGELQFTRSVRYDALSQVYRLQRETGGELLPDIQSALSGMTRYDVKVPLTVVAEGGKHYRAYVRTRLDRVGLSEPLRSIFFFSSLWDVETEWAKGSLAAP